MLSSYYQATVTNASALAITAAPKRRRITLYSPQAGQITVSQRPPVSLGAGINLFPGQPPIVIGGPDNKGMAEGNFFAISDSALGRTLAFYEESDP